MDSAGSHLVRVEQKRGTTMRNEIRKVRSTAVAVVSAAVVVLTGCQKEAPSNGGLIYEGFGNYERAISTESASAQQWFNQGMQLMYGFNHDEAIRSFEQAAASDPSSPMPWWGIAYCNGININDPEMTDERSRRAWEASQEAVARIDAASPVEAALVQAVAQRYAWPAPEDRGELEQNYADAMEAVYKEFPDDPDVAALFAEALMDLQPWDYWTDAGEPKGRTEEFVGIIERALETNPLHPGANHFFIHAIEASSEPDRAVEAADRLTEIVPGSGHLVHMPSHIYIRVGRYADAAQSNINAIEVDRAYLAKAPTPGMYAAYYGHNLHFLSFAAMMSGNYEQAIRAARDLEAEMPESAVRDFAGLIEGIMPATFHVLIRFGKWEQILEEPDYPEWRLVSRAVRRYARSIANSALDRTEEARVELEAFEEAMAEVPEEWWIFNNRVSAVLPIARAMINGELLFREGKRDEAYAILREGVAAEDALVYDEPPGWMLPVRHALGALLMADERYAEAEAVYREDLRRNRDNGWSLTGLQLALQKQKRESEAEGLSMRLASAFNYADTRPSSSCYCEP
jgi:tetratricopeptide (TPR) repeat protein